MEWGFRGFPRASHTRRQSPVLCACVVSDAAKFMQSKNIRCSVNNDSVTARFVGGASSDFTVKISAAEAGGIVVARYVVTFEDKLCDLQWRQDGIRAVSIANYGLVPGSFQCDPRDGEVKYENCFPVVILEADALQRALQEFFMLSMSTCQRYTPVWQAMLAQSASWRSLLSDIDPALTAGVGRGGTGAASPERAAPMPPLRDMEQMIVAECRRFLDDRGIRSITHNTAVTARFVGDSASHYTLKLRVAKPGHGMIVLYWLTYDDKLRDLSQRQDGVWAVSAANCGLPHGAFQCDPRDGEIKYQNSLPVVFRELNATQRALWQFLDLSMTICQRHMQMWQALLAQNSEWRSLLDGITNPAVARAGSSTNPSPSAQRARTPVPPPQSQPEPRAEPRSEPQPEAIPVPNDHTCPNNHPLLFQANATSTSDITCDACGRNNILQLGYYFACRPCNYNICRVCAQLPKHVIRSDYEARARRRGLQPRDDSISRLEVLDMSQVQVDETDCLGQGAFGIVAKGKYENTPVAVKISRHSFGSTPFEQRQFEHFLEEIKFHCSFRHPNIVAVYGACQNDEGKWMMVMEFCNRGTLEQHIDDCRLRGLPTSEAVRIATDIASGMAYLHSKNVLHADLKPANILMHEGTAKVSDFSLSVVLSASSRSNASQRGGSPLYVAPEAFGAIGVASSAENVYAYSLVVYELLTLHVPYEEYSGDANRLRVAVQQGNRPPLDQRTMDFELCRFVRACWASEPSERWTFEQCVEFLGTQNTRSR